MVKPRTRKSFIRRKNLRLPDFDYSQKGSYFITIVTNHRENLFGKIENGEMILNDAGEMIEEVCRKITQFMPNAEFDLHQVMPNHLHAIVSIDYKFTESGEVNENREQTQSKDGNVSGILTKDGNISLSQVIQRFKSYTTNRYIDGVNRFKWSRFDARLWQRNYYEHVIRNERDYEAITDYILSNPQNWEKDKEFK